MVSLFSFIKGRFRIAQENPLFWYNILLLGVTASVVWLWPGPTIENTPSDFRIRSWGMALQLIGAYTVWHDLSGAARKFGKTSIFTNTAKWVKRLIFGHGHAVGGFVAATANFTGSITAKSRKPQPPVGSPLESRIEILEYNLSKVDEELSHAFRQITDTESKLKDQINEESRKRDEAQKELRKDLHEAIVGNYATLVFGALWVAVGIVISAWAPEIAKAVSGPWTLVWRTV